MRYFTWYEDSKHIPVAQRIAEGIACYTQRYGHAPNVIAVNPDEPADDRVTKRLATIGRNNYWFGYTQPPLPGPDWQTQYPFCEEVGKTCPGEMVQDGRVFEYVPGSLLSGQAEYRERM